MQVSHWEVEDSDGVVHKIEMETVGPCTKAQVKALYQVSTMDFRPIKGRRLC